MHLLRAGARTSLPPALQRSLRLRAAPAAGMKRRLESSPPAATAAVGADANRVEEAAALEQAQLPDVAVVRPEEYEAQLQAKVQRVRELFSEFQLPEIQVHRSAPIHYRQRAEFRCVLHISSISYAGKGPTCQSLARMAAQPGLGTLTTVCWLPAVSPRQLHVLA